MALSSRKRWVVTVVLLALVGSLLLTAGGPAIGSSPSPPPSSVTTAAPPAGSPVASAPPVVAPEVSAPPVAPAPPGICSSLQSVNNDPSYAAFVQHVGAIASEEAAAGLPSSDVHLPYAGPIPDQTVNGVAMAGSLLSQECAQNGQLLAASQTEPTGVAYNGQTDVAPGVKDLTLDSNSVVGILTVNSAENFYPGSGTPTQWGAQENVVLPNVTILGQKCASGACTVSSNYAFWIQNVISYDSFNDTISFVDDTWNFTSGSASMFTSSLAGWSPNGGNYTGVWVAFSPYYYLPPPFTAVAWVNTSVNAAGDQVLWYNYSLYSGSHFVANGNYDYLIFNSQPRTGGPIALTPPDFEASAAVHHEVTEGYEFDAFIGADDGANQLMLGANATMQVEYCVHVPYCTPNSYAYASVPAAVNYGSQTGEQTVGIAVNYNGTTAYLSGGPLITHGLWNYTAQTGDIQGNVKVINAITVSGSPLSLSAQPYFFVFFNNTAYNTQAFQWAPDAPAWYLMSGTYRYTILLADYVEQNGTLVVPTAGTATLTATLPYNPLMGVYTPLWAFSNAQLAGISTAGSGTLGSQYLPFNNPTTGYFGFAANNVSALFYSSDDYHFPSFTGVLLDGTSAYVDLNALPSFCVHASGANFYYLGIEFFETSHITLSHDAFVKGWPSWEEISFYISVPASQNPAPQAEVFVWNSTDDLILSNTFIGTKTTSGSYVAPDALVLYGGSNNVVWGNTFRDPIGVALGTTYTGIGEADSNDLIYNNNFTVDNPIVYLPYNWANVADCLPQTLGGCSNQANHNGWYYNNLGNVVGNTWNVTLQPASNVVNTVNGFPLSGNVLGPGVTTQGGNYYWNYGTSPNNRTTSPYVSRFYYSDWSNIYPLGCGTIQAPGAPCGTAPPIVGAYQNGITAGGDYAPYGPTVTFTETGLPGSTPWVVTVGGTIYTSSTSSITVAKPYGTYSYYISAIISGYSETPTTGSILVSGAPTVHVTFTSTASTTYPVYVTESGLPSGTSWQFWLNTTGGGNSYYTSGTTVTLSVAATTGSYTYQVGKVSGYSGSPQSPSSGSVTVSASAVSVSATYSPVTYTVTFTENGLTGGTPWGLVFGGVLHWSTGTTISFQVGPGTYNWAIGYVAGETPSQSSGSTTITNTGAAYTITFTGLI